MEDSVEWKILKTCCDRLGLIIKTSVTYSKNDHFCSIVIDELFIAATKGNDLFDTINATITKAIRKIEKNSQQQQMKNAEQYEHVSETAKTNIDFDTELRRMLPLFEEYIVNFKERVERSVPSKETVMKPYYGIHAMTPPPIYNSNCFLTKNYTTSAEHCVKIESREVKVIKRKMLYPNSIGRKHYIDKSNIGFKMLLGLGWAGGPLGVNQDGIAEPISVELRTSRRGLGCVERQSIKSTFGYINYNNLFQYLKQYADDDQQFEDLEFSDDFSHKEKKKLFGISKDLNLQHVSEHRNGILVVKITKPTRN